MTPTIKIGIFACDMDGAPLLCPKCFKKRKKVILDCYVYPHVIVLDCPEHGGHNLYFEEAPAPDAPQPPAEVTQ